MASADEGIRDSPSKVCTIGYEGETRESFLRRMSSAQVARLVDVREVANSRKSGFSKLALSTFLADHGIEYVHLRSLGSPSEARKELRRTGDFESFVRAYESHLEEMTGEFETLVDLAREKPTAMMCFEKDASKCHRSIISRRLKALGFEVADL